MKKGLPSSRSSPFSLFWDSGCGRHSKYIDMRRDATVKAAAGANSELNARERLALASWKLKDGRAPIRSGFIVCCRNGETVSGPSTDLGSDWSGSTVSQQVRHSNFSRESCNFHQNCITDMNEPASWVVSTVAQ